MCEGNPYTLLQISPVFMINREDLDRAYFRLQRECHPDKAAPHNRKAAEVASAELNKAYQALKDPVARAKALANLHGYPLEIQANDPGILMEALEWRERTIAPTLDSTVRAQLDDTLQTCLNQIDSVFHKEEFSALSALVTRLAFLQKVREDIQGKGV